MYRLAPRCTALRRPVHCCHRGDWPRCPRGLRRLMPLLMVLCHLWSSPCTALCTIPEWFLVPLPHSGLCQSQPAGHVPAAEGHRQRALHQRAAAGEATAGRRRLMFDLSLTQRRVIGLAPAPARNTRNAPPDSTLMKPLFVPAALPRASFRRWCWSCSWPWCRPSCSVRGRGEAAARLPASLTSSARVWPANQLNSTVRNAVRHEKRAAGKAASTDARGITSAASSVRC